MARQSDEPRTSGKIQCLICLLSARTSMFIIFMALTTRTLQLTTNLVECFKTKSKNNFGSLDAHSGKHEFLIAKIIRKLQAEFSIITLTTTPSLLFLRNLDSLYTLQEHYLNGLVIGLGYRFQLFYLAFQFIKKAFGGL